MPEGPEIRRAVDRIAKVLVGEHIEDAFFEQRHLHNAAAAVVDTDVESVAPRGKAVVTRLSNGLALYSHNQLYGRWYITKRDKLPNTRRTLRMALHTRTHSALLYSASDIQLMTHDEVEQHPYIAKLGPDPLNEATRWQDIAERMRSPEFCRRSLSALYLDQHFVAGIGNYLRSEILFEAGAHPAARPQDLTRGTQGKLARATISLTRRAYQTAGITNAPRRVNALRKAGLKREQYRFAAFSRAGNECYRCPGTIQRISANSRRLYLCPSCQRVP